MSTPTVRVVARMVALPDQVDALKGVLLGLVAPTRREVGALKYELLQNRVDPTDFTFIEEWESEDALNAHLASAHLAAAIAKIPALVAKEPDIRRYDLLA